MLWVRKSSVGLFRYAHDFTIFESCSEAFLLFYRSVLSVPSVKCRLSCENHRGCLCALWAGFYIRISRLNSADRMRGLCIYMSIMLFKVVRGCSLYIVLMSLLYDI
jgi:hypothetical protein